jgi:hypothetical protein
MAVMECVAAVSDDVVHVAYPELTTRYWHPVISVPPFSNSTVPVVPVVTAAVKVIGELRFSGDSGEAPNEIVEDVNAGELAAVLVPAGPEPPLLKATTEKV